MGLVRLYVTNNKHNILGGSATDGFDYKGLSSQIREGAAMMDNASALLKKITSTFGSK